MLAFPGRVRIFVAGQPVDMRKQFNGLWTAVQEQLQEDPKSVSVRRSRRNAWLRFTGVTDPELAAGSAGFRLK